MMRKNDSGNNRNRALTIVLTLLIAAPAAVMAAPLGTVFTYQGQLLQNGSPTDGDFDIVFNLFDDSDPLASTLIATQAVFDVPVSGGLFAVELDFGDVWNGEELWVELRVRPAGSGGLVSLFPLQKVTASPNALFSYNSDSLDGVDSTGFITSESDPTVPASIKDGVHWGELTGIPSGLADGIDNEGVTTESDPTVNASVKDGVSWSEVTGKPGGFADDVDNVTDNLGNHSATQTIALNGNWITNDGVADGDGIFIQNNGKVGIGTSNPLNALHVIGFIRFTELGSGGQDLCRNSSRVLSLCGSSQRYKKNIADYAGGLEVVEQLRPVTFDWKQDDQHDLGLIAEEVAEIDPLLVTHRDDLQIEGVKYKQLTIVLVNALKEQQTQIEQLRSLVCFDHPERDLCR